MRTVVFSKKSKEQLDELMAYLEAKFSKESKVKFVLKLDNVIKIIQIDPETFMQSSVNLKIRKCVVSKQITLYYRFTESEIRLLALFDTRQNPEHIKAIK